MAARGGCGAVGGMAELYLPPCPPTVGATTVTTLIGGVPVGSAHPIVVQSMTNTDTADVDATVRQVAALARAGSQLVRVTVNNDEAAAAVPRIVARLEAHGASVPVIGDFHYNGHLLLTRHPDCARALAKYRINPGNVGGKRADENFRAIIEVALRHDKPVRIGVNWGSLDQNLLTEMMDANARLASPQDARDVTMEAMIESALRSAALAEASGMAHDRIVLSANGRIPTRMTYRREGSHSPNTFDKHIGPWSKIPAAFRKVGSRQRRVDRCPSHDSSSG